VPPRVAIRDDGRKMHTDKSDSRRNKLALLAVAAFLEVTMTGLAQASTPDQTASTEELALQGAQRPTQRPNRLAVIAKPTLDLSGKKRTGKASFYAHMFAGRKMADGKQMDPQHDNAASRTLPLGTRAKVTNLETGKSAFVTIQDRGPYVDGRIVDLSPSTAREIGISHRQGVARVEVSPLTVPLPNGGVKLGAAGQAVLARNDRASRPFPPIGW
jgi:rare lipoprotein A